MSIFGILIEGGQTWAHRMRMLRQVIRFACTLSLTVSLVVFVSLMLTIPSFLYQATWYHLKARTIGQILPQIEINLDFWEQLASERKSPKNPQVEAKKVTTYTDPYVDLFLALVAEHIQSTSTVSGVSLGLALFFFLVKGRLSKGKKHLSGRRLSPAWLLRWKLRLWRKASPIRIGNLPLLKGTETQHILITGGTGSGKTNCMHHILPQIRREGQKAIIVDTTGSFIEQYFRPGQDILLNPLDSKGSPWHPWAECDNPFDIENLVEGFIPPSYSEHDEYWRSASRTVFSALLQKTTLSRKTSELTRWLLFEPLDHLCNYVRGTKAAAHLDMNSEKTAASVRSVASSFLNCLEFLNDTDAPFSIRSWLRDPNQDSWLFLGCSPEHRASLRPLLSGWFSIATRSLIQMTPDLARRVWFIVDELPSLNRLKDLETFLTESRKYGGCALLALQSLAQLETLYGKDISKTIVGNCATKIAFAEQHHEIADKISRAFGQREIQEYQEGISYGAHETRDSVSLSMQKKSLPLVSVTDIQSLKRNQAFVKLPENIPVTKIKLAIAR